MPKRTYITSFDSGGMRDYSKRYKGSSYPNFRATRGYYRRAGYYGRAFKRQYWRRVRGRLLKYGYGPERKFFDGVRAAVVPAATGTILNASINLVPQGTGESEMIGRKIIVKRISMRLNCALPTAGPYDDVNQPFDDTIRICLILDKQANGAGATIGQIFESAPGIGNATYLSMMNLEYSKRFQIIKEWMINFDANGVAFWNATAGEPKFYKFGEEETIKWSKKKNIRIDFGNMAGATRNINEIRTNNLVVAAFTKRGLAAVEYYWRIRYLDE